MYNLVNVFKNLSTDKNINTESNTGVDLFKGSDENGVELEKYLNAGFIKEGFKFVSLEDLGTRAYDVNKLLKAGKKRQVKQIFKNYCLLYGVDNIFTSLDSFPPDFIIFTNNKIHLIEAKSTKRDSIRYGDNLPKPDIIYVLRDRKNKIQTFYYGEDILENYEKMMDVITKVDDIKNTVLKPLIEEMKELSGGLFAPSFRRSIGSTLGGKQNMPSLSPLRLKRENKVLEMVGK